MSAEIGMVVTGESLLQLAEQIVAQNEAGVYAPGCPCCDYDGMWPYLPRDRRVAAVYDMLASALKA